MDTSAQDVNQNPKQLASLGSPVPMTGAGRSGQNPNPNGNVSQPVQQSASQPMTAPLGKEGAPVVVPHPQEQWIQETAPQAEVAPDVKEAGVQAEKNEVIEVSEELSQAGVAPTGMAAAIPKEPTLKLPMTEEKAQSILKVHRKIRDSITWLAMLVIRQLKIERFKQNKEGKQS